MGQTDLVHHPNSHSAPTQSGRGFIETVRRYLKGPPQAPTLSFRSNIHLHLDGSPSTRWCTDRMRAGCEQFAEDIRRDAFLSERVDMAVSALDDDDLIRLYLEDTPAKAFKLPREVPVCSHSPIYGALSLALDHAAKRSLELANKHHVGVASHWLFVFSDFKATDGAEFRDRCFASLERAKAARVQLFLITLGDVDQETANALAQPGKPPIPLESVEDFTAFFKFVSRSLRQRSMSLPGASLELKFRGASLRVDA